MLFIQAGYRVAGALQSFHRVGMGGMEAGNLVVHLLVNELH
jgi:hypothetical protein